MEWDLTTEEIDLHPPGLRQGKGKPRKPDYELGKNSRQSNWVSVQTRFPGFMIFFYATWLNATLTPVLVLDAIG
ncbi:hypothetical protein D5086_018042 [Populus alba]|uniref:Uncharacterized protein n=1 Tax=Populus alba TaxID=43335 RepID=A0ACC4BPY7_POPAL